MKKIILPGDVRGSIFAPPSKSVSQRAIAASLLALGETKIKNISCCEDASAAEGVARNLGAKITRRKDSLIVKGAGENIGRGKKKIELNCKESGLCIRLFTPISALCSQTVVLNATGSLLSRYLGEIEAPMQAAGAYCKTNLGRPPIIVRGPLIGGRIEVDGLISSQLISGFLFALPLCKNDSTLVARRLASKPYVAISLSVLSKFGVKIEADVEKGIFNIPANQEYKPATFYVEGDWSSASFLLVAGAIAGNITVRGLSESSLQPDKKIVDALTLTGAKVRCKEGSVSVLSSSLCSFEFDATDCPDLFPPLVALACNCKGKSTIYGSRRLIHKESNRAKSLVTEFKKLGGKLRVNGDKMEIFGQKLRGGVVDSQKDHRIAMACAVAALCAKEKTIIYGAECVSKSYPSFFEDLERVRT
ncbi:MAG: 3-phosphoshikimate 1-carboxyvinyltransferase [Candidatus Anstonellales archaeon]